VEGATESDLGPTKGMSKKARAKARKEAKKAERE
jgi:hypothetical protein